MPARPPLTVLVTRVLAATAIIDREIARLAEVDDGDLTNLSDAIDKLTAIATAHSPLTAQDPAAKRVNARKARKAARQAADDAEADYTDQMGPDADVWLDVVEAVGSVVDVTVTTE
jgi:hypothetical protein